VRRWGLIDEDDVWRCSQPLIAMTSPTGSPRCCLAVCEAGTLTGQYLSGENASACRRHAGRGSLVDVEARGLHNLKGVDVRIPLGTLTGGDRPCRSGNPRRA